MQSLGDLDISFVLLNIISKFLLHVECYLLPPRRHIKISKQIKQIKRYISITKKGDTSITVIYHTMSPTAVFSHRDLNDLKTNTFVMTISNAYIRSVRLEYARSEILATHHLHTHKKRTFCFCHVIASFIMLKIMQ